MCKLFFSFTVILDVYRSFIPNKTTLTKNCLTQWISKLLRSFEIHLSCLALLSAVHLVVHYNKKPCVASLILIFTSLILIFTRSVSTLQPTRSLEWVLSSTDRRAGASTRFTSTSTSTSTCNMCEYEYKSEYLIITWVRVLVDEYEYKTSTGLWSTFYIGSSFSIFGLWQGSPQILKNLGQSSNYPLSIYICLIILCNLIHWRFNLRIVTCWLLWLTFTTCCQFKNRKQKLRNITKCVETGK